jgi:type I restriction enzyme S subunit
MKKISTQSIVEEMDNGFDLPEGWSGTSLEDLCMPPQYGWTTSAVRNGKGLKVLRTTDISSGKVDWTTVPYCEVEPDVQEKYLLRDGDIVVSRAGSVGISYLVKDPPRAVFASYLIRFRPKPPITGEFVSIFLNSPNYWRAIAEEATGITLPNVNASKLKALAVQLPPLKEQQRIVAKVEDLLARVNTGRERLTKVPKILKAFRQSVLAAACSGRLTEDWREKHPDVELPAHEPVPADWPDLPENWSAASLHSICTEVVDCPHSTPKWADSGKICIRTTNFLPGFLNLAEVRFVSHSTYAERISRLEPQCGDVLYSREGGILGIACQVPPGVHLCLGQRMMLMRSDPQKLSSTFLMHVLNSPFIIARVKDLTGGSASPHLNVGEIKQFPVPLPSVREQSEIVRRVEALFKLADQIAERLAAATKRADKPTQSILAKAFRGELVPTEAELARKEGRDYEPALVLLERIKSERERAPAARNGVRKPVNKRKN